MNAVGMAQAHAQIQPVIDPMIKPDQHIINPVIVILAIRRVVFSGVILDKP